MAKSAVGEFTSFQPGYRLVDGGELLELANMTAGGQSDVVGTAAPGPVLKAHINEVISGANVMLPPARPGLSVIVVSLATGLVVNAFTRNPETGIADKVNNAASVTLAGYFGWFVCYSLGMWFQMLPTHAVAPTLLEDEIPATVTTTRTATVTATTNRTRS